MSVELSPDRPQNSTDSPTWNNSAPAPVRRPEDMLGIIDSLRELIDAEATRESSGAPESIPEHPSIWPLPISAQLKVRTEPCVVCGEQAATPVFAINGIPERLVVCDECGLGSLFPLPAPQRIGDFYPAKYYGTPDAKFEPLVEAGVRWGAKFRVASLLRGLEPGDRVLDIGCGRGVMLRGMLDLGFEAHGVEISAAAAAGADPRAKIRIASRLQDAGYLANSFDAVVLWHVLEHLPRPDETLHEIARILRPGGRLIIAVPNFDSLQSRWAGAHWFHLDLPRHLFHFSPETLGRLVGRYGFETRSIRHFALLQNPFGWLQSYLNRTTNAPRNALYSLLHRYDGATESELTAGQRAIQRLAYWCGLPLAGLASAFEAACGRGGTMTLVAEMPGKIPCDTGACCSSATHLHPAFA